MSSLRFEQVKSVVLNNLNGSQLIGEGKYKFKCISMLLKLPKPYIILIDDSEGGGEGGGISTTAVLGKAILGYAVLGTSESSNLPKLIAPTIRLVDDTLIKLDTPVIELIDTDTPEEPILVKLATPVIELVDTDVPEEPILIKLQAPEIELVDTDIPEEPILIKLQAPEIELVDTDVPEEPILIKLATPVIELVVVPESDDYWTVTNNLTNATVANDITQVLKGEGYENNYLVNSGYKHSYHSLTIGGIESNDYVSLSEEDSFILVNIPSNKLNGNITMTVIAEKVTPKLVAPFIELVDTDIPEEPILIKLQAPEIELYEEVETITYTISKIFEGVQEKDNTETVEQGNPYNKEFTINVGHTLKYYNLTIGGVQNASCISLSPDNMTVYVNIASSELTGDVVITIIAETIIYYSVTKNVVGYVGTNPDTTIANNDTYLDTFNIIEGYEYVSSSMTVGGVSYNGISFDETLGSSRIYIDVPRNHITGDIVINITAKQKLPKLTKPTIKLEESSGYKATFYQSSMYNTNGYYSVDGGNTWVQVGDEVTIENVTEVKLKITAPDYIPCYWWNDTTSVEVINSFSEEVISDTITLTEDTTFSYSSYD